MRLPPIIRRLNSWPPILPIGRVSWGGVAVETAGGAGGWAADRVALLRPSGTAAEAMREDFTKPRRDICFSMSRAIAVPGKRVKHAMQVYREERIAPLLAFRTR